MPWSSGKASNAESSFRRSHTFRPFSRFGWGKLLIRYCLAQAAESNDEHGQHRTHHKCSFVWINSSRSRGFDDQNLAPFFDAVDSFEAGQDVIISAYQVEAVIRPQVRKIQKASGWRPEQIRVSCAQVHLLLSHWLWGQGIPNLLTVGNILKDGMEVYHPTLESLRRELMQEIDPLDRFDAHAWLTFPDLTIIDATWWFYEHRANLPKTFSWPDRVHFGEPVVDGRTYHPMVIGTRFLANALRLPPWLHA